MVCSKASPALAVGIQTQQRSEEQAGLTDAGPNPMINSVAICGQSVSSGRRLPLHFRNTREFDGMNNSAELSNFSDPSGALNGVACFSYSVVVLDRGMRMPLHGRLKGLLCSSRRVR